MTLFVYLVGVCDCPGPLAGPGDLDSEYWLYVMLYYRLRCVIT
jgi:hypothetical protein